MPPYPHGASLSLRGPGRTGGARVSPPLCGGGNSSCVLKPPRGVPIPPRPRQDRRDSGVTAAVWGRDLSTCPQTPTGRPYPSAAQAGPEGLGCNRRCVGGGDFIVRPQTPTGRPYPSAAQAGPERLGCNRRCVGRDSFACPHTPTGRPYPSAAHAGPEGLGCSRRCVGEGPLHVPPNPLGASLSLRGPGRTGGTRV